MKQRGTAFQKGTQLKTILSVVLALLCTASQAQPVVVNCADSTLSTTYSASAPSLQPLFTNLASYPQPRLMIANPTGVAICATPVASNAPVPDVLTSKEHCVPAGAIMAWDGLNMVTRGPVKIYLRANEVACTTGIFYADYW